VVEPLTDEMIEKDFTPEFIINNEGIRRILWPQIDKSGIPWGEERIAHHPVTFLKKKCPFIIIKN